MKYLLPLLLLVTTACNGPETPSQKEIEAAAKALYLHQQEADGAGGWTVTSVQVISTEPGADKRHYKAVVEVSGVHKAPPLAIPKPDEPFTEKKTLNLIWRGGQWVEESTYND